MRRTAWLPLLALLAASAMATPVAADHRAAGEASLETPMVFARVRGYSRACEPRCPEWISAEGTIVDESVAALREVLEAADGLPLPLVINSEGGKMQAAAEMGRLIRELGSTTVVGRTVGWTCAPADADCRPEDGLYRGEPIYAGTCRSACTVMFAGGVVRLSADYTEVGIHRPYSMERVVRNIYERRFKIENGKKVYYKQKRLKRRIIREVLTPVSDEELEKLASYFIEMGVRREIVEYFRSTPPEDMRRLLQYEKQDLNFITNRGGVEAVTDPAKCMHGRSDAICVTRKDAAVDPR